jgi:CRP-like cAMP-binding protein
MSGLPPALAARLWSNTTTVNAKAGRTLISQGSTSTNAYVVLRGRLQVMLFSMSGREIILRDLAEGEIFGELAAIDGLPRSATIISLCDCTLGSIPGTWFRDAIGSDPEAPLWLARRLTAQIRDLTNRVYELNALRVSSRLHCELLRRCASADDDETDIPIRPFATHAKLAACIGTHREAVTRELNYLAERGIIRQDRRAIVVRDTRALAELVQTVVGESASLQH